MSEFEDPFVAAAGQHLFEMADAEHLPGAVGSGQQFARQFGRVVDTRRVEAIVAIAAIFGRLFAEMPEQNRAPAPGCFDQPRQRRDPSLLGSRRSWGNSARRSRARVKSPGDQSICATAGSPSRPARPLS